MEKSAINIIGFENCCSCGLCQNTCPFNAITMSIDERGFYKPYIDSSLCTNCGVCSRTCPIIKDKSRNLPFDKPYLIGGWSCDKGNVTKSSSGGIFYELSKAFVKAGGSVYGVRWKNRLPAFDVATTIDQLNGFRGSKYLQAETSYVYKKIKADLRNGKKVLFFGLPCQIQAASNFITADNFYCIDLVCAGVPSILMYSKYCQETFRGKNVTHVNFRAKEKGKPAPWRRFSLEFYSKENLLKREYHGTNPFFRAFNSTKTYNHACYDCKFNTIPRRGDLTLCDYWGAPSNEENPEGTSLILINNSKGENLFHELLEPDCAEIHTITTSLEDGINGTRRIDLPKRDFPSNYNQIFESLQKNGFYSMYNKYIKPSLIVRILRRLKLSNN